VLNLNQLRVFFEVAKSGSFTAAAAALGISQPAVSMQIKNFQESLDVTLYRVDGRNLVLTEVGRELFCHAERIFVAARDAEIFLQNLKKDKSILVKISTTRTVATYFLPRIMRLFNSLHRNVQIQLDICTNDQAIEAVIDARSDFAFAVDTPSYPNLVCRTLFTDELIAVSRPTVFLATGPDGLDFTDTVFLHREKGSRTRITIDEMIAANKIKVGQALELADVEAIKSSVKAGIGVTILPAISAQEEIEAGALKGHRIFDGELTLRFDAIYRKSESSPITRAFLSALVRSTKETGR
jgi:DNA-binding transcriptional LysR family regulator